MAIDKEACNCGAGLLTFVVSVDDLTEGLALVISTDLSKNDEALKEFRGAIIKTTVNIENGLVDMQKYCGFELTNSIKQIKNISELLDKNQKLTSGVVDKIMNLLENAFETDKLDMQFKKCGILSEIPVITGAN